MDNLDPNMDNQDPNAGNVDGNQDGSKGKFFDGFGEEVRNHPSVQKFSSAEDLAKSYVNLEKKIGAKGIILPGEKATPEEIAEFHKAIGCIDSADKVEIVDLPKGTDDRIQVTDETKAAFKELAIKAHLTPAQAKAIQEFHLNNQVNQLKAYDAATLEEKQKSETALRGEWGAKFDENVQKVNQLVKSFGGDEALDWFTKGEGNNPIVLKMLAKIAGGMSEDSMGERGKSGIVKTPAEAQAEITAIRNDKSHPYNNADAMGHKEAVKYMETLYSFLHPEPAKGQS